MSTARHRGRTTPELIAALSVFTSIGARFEAARTQLELAELAQRRGDLAAASAWLGEAAQAFVAMGVSRYDERVQRLLGVLPGTLSTLTDCPPRP